MADTKISALTAATTPLAGTEVLPIVQSSTTKNVSIANLTAGRSVSAADVTASTGNLIVSTTGKGITTGSSIPLGFGTNNGTTSATLFTTGGFSVGTSGDGGAGVISAKNQFRLDAASYTRVADADGSGGFGGGYNFKMSGATTPKYDSTGLIAGVWYDGNGVIRFYTGGSAAGGTNATQRVSIDSSGDTTLSTGNLIQGTAAKGINFTANSAAAGMTSQLLNWYEEGTWTPTDTSGAGLTLTISNSASYVRVGKLVTVQAFITYPTTASVLNASIGGLPFPGSSITYAQSYVFTNSGLTFNNYLNGSNSQFDFRTNTNTNITNANLSTKFVIITFTYRAD